MKVAKVLIAVAWIAMAGTSRIHAQDVQRFDNPVVGNYHVDRCFRFGAECDKPAADAYCRLKGFASAREFPTVGRSPTWVLGDDRTCDADYCGGFTYITCEGRSGVPTVSPVNSVLLNRSITVERCADLAKGIAPGLKMAYQFHDTNAQLVSVAGNGLIVQLRCAHQKGVVVIYGSGTESKALYEALGWWYAKLDTATKP